MDTETNETQAACNTQMVVLLVDDQRLFGESVRRTLANASDIAFHFTTDPNDIPSIVANENVTIILLDLMMPGWDGIDLIKKTRADSATREVPIMVLSGKDDANVKHLAFENGATDYVVKMPHEIELIARIRAHSRSYLAYRQRDEALRELEETKRRLLDLTDTLANANADLISLAEFDGLTGVFNRPKFDKMLNSEWNRAQRTGTELSILMMDIDHFKQFNDHYGHLHGDHCLKTVANALREVVRRTGDILARYGGEEFVVLLPTSDTEGSIMLAEKLREAVVSQELEHAKSTTSDFVTLSIGAATLIPNQHIKPTDLIERADLALYRSKENGRNQVTHARDLPDSI